MHQPARKPWHPQHQRVVHALCHAGAQQDFAEQHEKRDRDQQEVVRGAPGDLAHRKRERQLGVNAGEREPEKSETRRNRNGEREQPDEDRKRDAEHQFCPSRAARSFRSRISSSTSSSAERVEMSCDIVRPSPPTASRSAVTSSSRPMTMNDARPTIQSACGMTVGVSSADWLRDPEVQDCATTPSPCHATSAKKPTSSTSAITSNASRSFCGNST